MEAILLVGGQGTRLRPLTENTPKPMLQVAGIPCTEHQIAKVREAGADRVILATSYLAEIFKPYFGDGSRFGVELIYAYEDVALGTGGAIANAGRHLEGSDDEIVVVLNGDILSSHDLAAQCRLHRERSADVTLHLTEVADARNFGCVPIDADGRVTQFLEKMPNPVTNLINAGCYTFSAGVIRAIPQDRVVSVERETFPQLLADGSKVFGYVDKSYWLDLGTPQAYLEGSCDVVTGVCKSPAYTNAPSTALVMDGAVIAASAEVSGGSSINPGVHIGENAVIDAAVILPRASIGVGAVVRHAIIGAGATVGAGALVEGPGTCIGDDIEIAPQAQISAGTVIPSI